MKDILLDTNVLGDFFCGEEAALEVLRSVRHLCVNTVVIGELLAGFALGSRSTANKRYLSSFLLSPRVTVLELGQKTAEHYADIWAGLRRKGRPLPTNDVWIAATAREHGLVLYTRDAHFHEVDGILLAASADDLLL